MSPGRTVCETEVAMLSVAKRQAARSSQVTGREESEAPGGDASDWCLGLADASEYGVHIIQSQAICSLDCTQMGRKCFRFIYIQPTCARTACRAARSSKRCSINSSNCTITRLAG